MCIKTKDEIETKVQTFRSFCFCKKSLVLMGYEGLPMFVFLVRKDSGVSLWGRISHLPEQPCWPYA